MKKLLFFLHSTLILSCSQKDSKKSVTVTRYSVLDYVTVGKMMDTVKTPYIIDVSHRNKRIVFIGCVHDADSSHPQYRMIEKYFEDLKPALVFNEGGQIADSIHYNSQQDAILRAGETGVLKYYADRSGISMLDGDMDAKTEFALTLKKIPRDDLLLYYVMERIAIPYHYSAHKEGDFENRFNQIIKGYFIKNGFPLSATESQLSYFERLYQQALHKPFNIDSLDLEAFDYVNDSCTYCAIGRISKTIRDSVLLSKIDAALDKYDRLLITFGHGHALAVAPALRFIVTKKRHDDNH